MMKLNWRRMAWLGVVITSLATSLVAQGAFNGGGGPLMMGALFDLSELKEAFKNTLNISGDINFGEEEYYLMYGGGGFGGSDIRLGGMGASGEWTFPVNGEAAFDRVLFNVHFGGFMFESVIGSTDQGGLSIGGVLGMGNLELQLIQDFQGSFDDFIADPPLKFAMTRTFWYAQPFVAVEVQLLEFMGVRLSGSYNIGFSLGEWELSDEQEVPGGPLKSMGFPSIQLMVVFGG